ncbi:hypothetical protein A2U01_0063278, partial [Trifolium medium]|nr:hypothetical protein [Trifolium medium]
PNKLGIPVVVSEALVNFEGDKGEAGFVEAEGSELRLEDEQAVKVHMDAVVPSEKAMEKVQTSVQGPPG